MSVEAEVDAVYPGVVITENCDLLNMATGMWIKWYQCFLKYQFNFFELNTEKIEK